MTTATLSTPTSRPVLTVRVSEAAAMTGLSRTLLYQLMDSGKLRYSKVGRCRLIRVAELDRLVDALCVGQSPESTAAPIAS